VGESMWARGGLCALLAGEGRDGPQEVGCVELPQHLDDLRRRRGARGQDRRRPRGGAPPREQSQALALT
jgi:hypothetical protein